MSEWNIKIGTTLDTSDAKKKLDALIQEYSNSDKAKINVGLNIKGEEKLNNLKGTLKEIKNLAKSIGTVKIDVSSSLGNISADSIKQIESSTQQLQSATQEISKHLTDGIERSVKATTSSLNAELKGITRQVNTMLKAFDGIDLELLDPNQQRMVEMTIAKLETLKGQNIKAFDQFQLAQAESTIKETLQTFEEMTNVTGKKMFQTNYVDGFIHKMETVKTVMEGMGIATDNIELLIDKAKGLYEASSYVDNMRVAYQSLNKELREQVTKPFQLTGVTSDEMGLDKLIKYRDELTKKIYDSKPGTDMSKTIQQLAVVENAIDKIKAQLNNVGTETAKALDMKSLVNQSEMAGNAMAKSAKEQEKYQKQVNSELQKTTKAWDNLKKKSQSLDMTSGVDVSKWRAVNIEIEKMGQDFDKLDSKNVTMAWLDEFNSRIQTVRGNIGEIEAEAERLNLKDKFDIDVSKAESAINGIHASLVQLGRDTEEIDKLKAEFESLKDLGKADLGQASSGLKELLGYMKDFGKENNLGEIAGTMKQLEGYVKDFNNAVSKSMSTKDLNLAERFEDEAKRSADAIKILLNGMNDVDDEIKNSFERMTSSIDSSEFSKQLQNIITDVNKYKAVMQNLNQNIKFDELKTDVGQGLAQEFNQAIAKAQELENALNNMLRSGEFDLSEFNRLKSELEDAKARVASFSNESIIIRCDEAIANLRQLKNAMDEVNHDSGGVDNLIADYQRLGEAIQQSTVSYRDAMNQIRSYDREASNLGGSFESSMNSMNDMGSSIRGIFESISEAFSSVSLGMMLEEGIENMAYSIKDVIFQLDDALTQFSRVAPDDFALTDTNLQQVAKDAKQTAISVGQSVEDVIIGMSTALQAGATTMQQASAIAEKSAILQNVSDMDATSASQAVSSMITQYYSMDTALSQVTSGAGKAVQGYSNLTEAIDMVNYAGNNFAISTQGVTEALQDGGSTLSSYGVTLSDSIALISGANESLQDPSRVGNGLKSIAINLAGLKTSAKDGTIELNKTAMGLKEIAGIDIFTDSSKTSVKDMMTIMDELNGKWGELTETQQLALSEGIAGKHQSAVFQALMQNWERVKQFQDEYNKGWMIGSAQRENEIYLDSVAGKFNTLKENLKGILTNNVSTSLFKDILDGANKVVVAVDKISQALGKIGSAGALAGILSMVNAFKSFGTLNLFGGVNALGQTLTGVFSTGILGTITSGFTKLKTIATSTWSSMASGQGALAGLSAGLETTGVKATIAQVGMGLLKGVLTGFVVAGVIAGIVALCTALDNYIHKTEKTVESSKEMQQSIQAEMQSLNTQKSGLSAIATEYDTLAQKTNKTAEEMKRFSELKQQIAEISPELVVGYDSNNDPILALNGSLTSYIADLDVAIAKQQELYNGETEVQARAFMEQNAEDRKTRTTWDLMTDASSDGGKGFQYYLQALEEASQAEIKASNNTQKVAKKNIEAIREQGEVRREQIAEISALQAKNYERDATIQQHYLNQWAKNTKLTTDQAKESFSNFFTKLDWGTLDETSATALSSGLQKLESVTATTTSAMGQKFQDLTAKANEAFKDTGAIQKYGQSLRDIALESGKFDMATWTNYLDEVNTKFQDGEMNAESYRHALQYMADSLEHLTGIDASTWMDSLVGTSDWSVAFDNMTSGLNKFLASYNKGMSDIRSGDTMATILKEQFSALQSFGSVLNRKIETKQTVSVEWLLEQKNDLPMQMQHAIDMVTANGKVTEMEQLLLLAVQTEIENEGELSQQTIDLLNDIIDGSLDNFNEKEITIGNIKFDREEINSFVSEMQGASGKVSGLDFNNKSIDGLVTQAEGAREAISKISDTHIRIAMDAQGFDKKEEIDMMSQAIEGIDGKEAKCNFIADTAEYFRGAESVEQAIASLPPEIKLRYQIGIEGDSYLTELNNKLQALPPEIQTMITVDGSYSLHDLEEIKEMCDVLGNETVTMLLSLEGAPQALEGCSSLQERLQALAELVAKSEVGIEGGDEVIAKIDEIVKGLIEADGQESTTTVTAEVEGEEDVKELEEVVDGVTDEKEVNVTANVEGEEDVEELGDKTDELDGKDTESNHTANSDDSDLDETEKKIEKLTQDTHGNITVHAETGEVVQAQIDKDRLEVDGKSITTIQVDGQGQYNVAINDKGQLEVNGKAITNVEVNNGEELKFAINEKGQLEVNGIALTNVEILGSGKLEETGETKKDVEKEGTSTTIFEVVDGQLVETEVKLDEMDGKVVESELKMTLKETVDTILAKLGLNKSQANVEIKVTANTAEATKQINSITSAKPGDVTINVKAPDADSVKSKLDSLTSKSSHTFTINVTAPNLSKIKSDVDALASKSIGAKSFTVSANGLADVTNRVNTLANRKIATKTFSVNCTDNATSKLNAIINKKIATKTFKITCTDSASSKISSVSGKKISDKKFTINCTDSATSKVNKVQGLKISNKSFTISCKDNASGTISSIKRAMSGLGNKTVTITVKKKEVTGPGVSDPRVIGGQSTFTPTIANEEGYVASANNIVNATNNISGAMVSAKASTVSTYANTGYTIRALQADVDLLTNLNAMIEKITSNLGELQAQQERTWGGAETSLLKQQIALLERQQQLTKATEKNMEDMADRLRGSLSGKGFIFNSDGSIDNYNSKLITMTENVEKLRKKMDDYTGDDENQKKKLSDAYNKANDELTKIKEQASEYLDLTFKGIPDAQKEWEELANSIAEAKAEIIKANHEQQVFYEEARLGVKEAIVDKYDTQISIIEVKADIGDFKDKIRYMNEEISIMQSAMSEVKKMQDTAYVKAKDLRKILSEKGFKFGAEGELWDAEGTLKNLRGSMSDAEFEAIQEVYEDYVDTFYNTMPDLEKQWWDYQKSIEETEKEIEELIDEMKALKRESKLSELERAYDRLSTSLEILETQSERVWGKNKQAQLEKQIDLLEEMAKENKSVIKGYEDILANDKKELISYGITFDDDGNIENLEEALEGLSDIEEMEKLQDLVDNYNDLLDEKTNRLKDIFDLENQVGDLRDEILELNKELEDLKVDSWTTQFENSVTVLQNQIDLIEEKLELSSSNQIDLLNKQLELYELMGEEVEESLKYQQQRERELSGVLKGYGFEINDDGTIDDTAERLAYLRDVLSETEFEQLQDYLSEYFEVALENIPELEQQLIEFEKNQEEILRERLEIAEEVEQEITKAYEEQVEKRIEEIEKEADARVEALNKAKDAYQKYRDEVEYNRDYDDQLKKVQDLQSKIEIAKRDTSLAGQKRVQELMDELMEEQKSLEELVQDKIDTDINNMFEDEIDRVETESEDEIKRIEELWSASNIAEAVKNALATGIFEDIDGNIMSLDEALLNFANNSEDYLGVMGATMKKELLDNLDIALDTVKQLEEIYANLSTNDYGYLDDLSYINSEDLQGANVVVEPSSKVNNINIGDTVITIQGNADNEVVGDIEELLEQYKKDIYVEIFKNVK